MPEINNFFHKIKTKILILMLVLFAVTALVVSMLNQLNLHKIYENDYTQQAVLTNSVIATMIDANDVRYYVELLRNQDDAFKKRQIQFFNERKELFQLREKGSSPERQAELLNSMRAFHSDMNVLKSDRYWSVVENFRQLKTISHSKYIYVFADTGVTADDGTKLYTYIFDAGDANTYDDPDVDGLGTVSAGEEIVNEIYKTKKTMDTVMHYNGIYGELYYAYAPVLDQGGNVIAILGTDVDLVEMHQGILKSTILFTMVFLSFGIILLLVIYIFVHRYITNPLDDLTGIAQKLADGDVYASVSETGMNQHSELGILAHAVSDMSGTYKNLIKSTEELFDAARIGKLDIRNDASKYKGDVRMVIERINDTLDAVNMYLNGVPEGILIMSRNFETYFRNEQYVRFFGDIPASEFITDVFPQDSEKHFTELLKQTDNSTAIWINSRCYSVTFKEINLHESIENSILVITMDITDLMREKENAQAAAKAKSDFLSRMSHEMRTPMNAIIGMTKIAENTEDTSKLKYCLSTIDTSAKLLLGIINDVLDMSKIEAGKFELENIPLNLEKVLADVGNIIREDMEKKGHTFNVILGRDLYLNYIGDELRLSQVITNLLSNAVKFTPVNGTITLMVDETDNQGDICTLRFSVSDTGIGMTEAQIGHLFNSFEQADGSITRRFGGTGLGLAISKTIVEKMRGHIWVESHYGSGSKFTFEVKLERAPFREIKTDVPRTVPDFSGISILLAEDVELNREIFLALLDETHISIDAAENGSIAVSMFKENPDKYDMIIMDIQMPEMDGYEATRTIRALDIPGAKSIPIIAMTANVFKEDIERCRASGMNDHLAKPIDETAVIEKITLFSKRRTTPCPAGS